MPSVSDRLRQTFFKYQADDGSWQYIPKSLEWLHTPVKFHQPQCDLVRNRNYRLLKNGQLSLTTLKGTISVDFIAPPAWQQLINEGFSLGTAKLIHQSKHWYLCVPMSKSLPPCNVSSIRRIVGIDRGLNFIAATADSDGHSLFFNGRVVLHRRHQFNKVRQSLQLKNTRNSRRKLLAIGQRESRWMSDVNHCLSKSLVDKYGADTLFVLEDLTGITFDEKILSGIKQQRNDRRSWAFYQLEEFLKYKTEERGSLIIKVSPRYTSQRCPRCGIVDKNQRHHEEHEYRCRRCGYRTNDDRVGALNLLESGKRYPVGDNSGDENSPAIRKLQLLNSE